MSKYQTILHAEDGTYYEEHETKDAALEYVTYQMGENPEPYNGGWMDNYGRHMYIVRADTWALIED